MYNCINTDCSLNVLRFKIYIYMCVYVCVYVQMCACVHIRPGNVRISHDDLRAPQSNLEVNSKLRVFIYLVVFLLEFHSDFIMVSARSCNFVDACV